MSNETDLDAPRPVRDEKAEVDIEAADARDLSTPDTKLEPPSEEEHGKAWQTDVHTIPKNNLPLVFAGVSAAP